MRILADLGTGLIRRLELDRVQLAALARVQRRPGIGGVASAPKDVQSRAIWRKSSIVMQFALLVVLGLPGAAGVLFPSFFLGLVFSYTLIMLIFGLPLLNHCAVVLLDTSENRILLHLPIRGSTLLAARLLSVTKYAGILAFSTSLPTAIAIAVRFRAVALFVFVISLVLTLMFLVAVVLAACLFALRHVNPARLREGILWLQTALFVVAAYAATLVLNAGVPLAQMVPAVTAEAWWYFYPPGWMAGLLDFSVMEQTRFNGVLAATAILVPLAGFVGCILLFERGRFSSLLSRLEVVPARRATTPKSLARWFARLPGQISVFMSRDKQERAAFDLASKLIKKDAVLKRQSFPFVAAILLNAGIFVVKFRHGPLPGTALFMYCYVPLFLAITGPLIQYNAEWRAAWCYQILPFARPGVIVSGAMKAYIWKYILPIYLLLLVVGAAAWGNGIALNVLFALAVTVLVCVRRFWSAGPAYSKDPALLTQNGRMSSRLSFIPVAVGLIAAHVALKTFAGDWGVAGAILAMVGAITVAFRRLRFMGPRNDERKHEVWNQREQTR